MEKIEILGWLFENRPRQGKILLPDGLNWLCYFAGNSKNQRDNFGVLIIQFLSYFGIPSSSRHEKRCQILQTLFWVFQIKNLKLMVTTQDLECQSQQQLPQILVSYSSNPCVQVAHSILKPRRQEILSLKKLAMIFSVISQTFSVLLCTQIF